MNYPADTSESLLNYWSNGYVKYGTFAPTYVPHEGEEFVVTDFPVNPSEIPGGTNGSVSYDGQLGRDGTWLTTRLRLKGRGGKWVETFNNEPWPAQGHLDIRSISLRSGNHLQGGLEINGTGLNDVLPPAPAGGAFYSLRGVRQDFFENFGNLLLLGTPEPVPSIEDGFPAFMFNAGYEQWARFPLVESTGVFDLLGLIGNDGEANGPRGTRYWEIGGQFKPKTMPTGDTENFVLWSGDGDKNIAVWYTSDGKLHARLKNNPYVAELVLDNAVVAQQWTGFCFRHRPVGNDRYLDLMLHDGRVVTMKGDLVRTVGSTTYNEFGYFVPPEQTAIEIARGMSSTGTAPSPKFFLPEFTHSAFTIAEDGFEITGTQTAYRSSISSDLMHPGTGRYYIEIQNFSSYDLHIGVTDLSDVTQAPGVIGWAVNTINGRKFAKQTGGGTSYTTATPANSVIGIVYDSNTGIIEHYVNGTKRPNPFPAGTITVPVRFIVGGRAQTTTTNTVQVKVTTAPSQWLYTPTGTLLPVPHAPVAVSNVTTYSTLVPRNLFARNTPMQSDQYRLAVLDPGLSFEVLFENRQSGEIFSSNLYLLKVTPEQLLMSVPEIPYGQYGVRCQYKATDGTIAAYTSTKLFTISEFAPRTSPLHIDFGVDSVATISRELMAAHKQWGGANGGVVAENIRINRVTGLCELDALGDQYTGPIRGVDRLGNPVTRRTRIGACLVTRDYFGPGSYRVVCKPVPVKGVCNAFWTIHYEEAYLGSPLYNRHILDGLHRNGDAANGYYTVRNHEIDIEFPTALKTTPDQEDVSHLHARFNTWHGELRNWDVPNKDVPVNDPNYSPVNDPAYWSEYTDDFVDHGIDVSDGEFHEFRFDWHLGSDPRVEYYIDGVLCHTVRTHVPDIPGRYWAGLWFPSAAVFWAGRPAAWATQTMYVKSMTILPYEDEQQFARNITETFPFDVFRDFQQVVI